jgi:hypothetical protein
MPLNALELSEQARQSARQKPWPRLPNYPRPRPLIAWRQRRLDALVVNRSTKREVLNRQHGASLGLRISAREPQSAQIGAYL